MQKEQLIEVILRLLGAWGDPLTQLYWSIAQGQNQDFNHFGSNKALEISDIVLELRDGVAKMVEKVRIHAWLLICCVVISNGDLICLVIWNVSGSTCNVKLYSVFSVFFPSLSACTFMLHTQWKSGLSAASSLSVYLRWSFWECLATLWVSSLLRVGSPHLPFPSTNKESHILWTITTYSTASAGIPTKSKTISTSWDAPLSLIWAVNGDWKAVWYHVLTVCPAVLRYSLCAGFWEPMILL